MNPATRRITVAMAALLAFAGFEHGLFASLQGNRSTGGFAIQAIGKDFQWWVHGGEDAVTLIPNFLASGLAAMAVSVLVVAWAAAFAHRRHGVRTLLLLFIALTAVGGGVGYVPFFLVTCAYSSRINAPLCWWRKKLPQGLRGALARVWPHAVVATAVCWLLAIEIAVFGYVPGMTDPDARLYTCWSLLLLAMLCLNAAYVAGFAADLEREVGKAL